MSKAPRRKHIPQRTCIVCRDKLDKRDLIRIVRSADGGVSVDLSGKHNGRGAYICHKPSCWEKLLTSSLLDKALKTAVTPSDKEALANFRATHLK